ncbi:MAG: hypothetical protein ACE5G1_01855 [bacterium]
MNEDLPKAADMTQNGKVCVLYSGGSDSVLAATVLTQSFEELHLLTFTYTCIAEGAERSKVNVERLRAKYPQTRFVHEIFFLDALLKEIIHGRLLRDFLKYRLFVVAMCPICKIAMHIRTLAYCLDHQIFHVCDGANQARGRTYPEQVKIVMNEYRDFYKSYGIEYSSPIYEAPVRTDHMLYDLGIYTEREVKYNPALNCQIEPDCNYKSLFHTVSIGYYRNLYSEDKFEEITVRYYREKFAAFRELIREYMQDKENCKLARLIGVNGATHD